MIKTYVKIPTELIKANELGVYRTSLYFKLCDYLNEGGKLCFNSNAILKDLLLGDEEFNDLILLLYWLKDNEYLKISDEDIEALEINDWVIWEYDENKFSFPRSYVFMHKNFGFIPNSCFLVWCSIKWRNSFNNPNTLITVLELSKKLDMKPEDVNLAFETLSSVGVIKYETVPSEGSYITYVQKEAPKYVRQDNLPA